MDSPYDQFDSEIRKLIRQGCTSNEVSKKLQNQYPQLINQAAQILKCIQATERDMRKSGLI